MDVCRSYPRQRRHQLSPSISVGKYRPWRLPSRGGETNSCLVARGDENYPRSSTGSRFFQTHSSALWRLGEVTRVHAARAFPPSFGIPRYPCAKKTERAKEREVRSSPAPTSPRVNGNTAEGGSKTGWKIKYRPSRQ